MYVQMKDSYHSVDTTFNSGSSFSKGMTDIMTVY